MGKKKEEKPEKKIEVNAEEAQPKSEEPEVVEEKSEEVLLLSKEEVAELKQKLEKALNNEKENLEGWQRERADFSNYMKRIDREQSQAKQNYKADVLKKFIAIEDDLSLALKNRPTEGPTAAWADGITLIIRKLGSLFENEGLVQLDVKPGSEFDPKYHQAISYEPSEEFKSGEIIEVLQKGYKMGDRVIRPALVRVAK